MSRKKTHEEYVAELAEKNLTVRVIEQYIDAKTPILHYCTIHDVFWSAYPTNVLRGCGCHMCGNNIQKTHDQYVEEVAIINPNIEVIDHYVNARTPISHRCKIDGYVWKTAPYVILRGDGCPRCAGNAKKTAAEYIDELAYINSNIEVIGEYINASTPIAHQCKIDGYVWNVAPRNVLSGKGCPKCKFSKLTNMFLKTHNQYIDEIAVINPDLEVLEQYVGAHTPILHRCKKDNYEWKVAPANVLSGQGCPQCQESNGERMIRQWLDNKHIEYIPQKTFDDCRDKRALPFDFYLPDRNMCIEYDGEQHFRSVEHFGGEEGFKKRQLHDQIKNQYCKNNNIPLLRIPYFKNVEEELNNFLFI